MEKNSSSGNGKARDLPPFMSEADRLEWNRINTEIDRIQQTLKDTAESIEAKIKSRNQIEKDFLASQRTIKDLEKRTNSITSNVSEVEASLKAQEKEKRRLVDEFKKKREVVESKWNTVFRTHHSSSEFKDIFEKKGKAFGMIENKIELLEKKQSSTTMALSMEKKLVSDIDSLTSLKSALKDYYSLEHQANDDYKETKIKEKRERLNSKKSSLNEELEKEQAKKEELEASLEDLKLEIDSLFQQKHSSNSMLKSHYSALKSLRSRIDEQKSKWIQEKEETRLQEKLSRELKKKEQQDAKARAYQKRVIEANSKPLFGEEIKVCDKLKSKLQSLFNDKKKNANNSAVLSIDILLLFEQLSLLPPKQQEQVPDVLQQIDIKKKWLLELQQNTTIPPLPSAVPNSQEENSTSDASVDED